ncbi:hypothetical protein BZZ01_13550 [Nostocales cyanobacterium HT-58-2]|nr:hypothetical protein BZZ01_13550 [Nostocales cyanobacterium HT-58-2]
MSTNIQNVKNPNKEDTAELTTTQNKEDKTMNNSIVTQTQTEANFNLSLSELDAVYEYAHEDNETWEMFWRRATIADCECLITFNYRESIEGILCVEEARSARQENLTATPNEAADDWGWEDEEEEPRAEVEEDWTQEEAAPQVLKPRPQEHKAPQEDPFKALNSPAKVISNSEGRQALQGKIEPNESILSGVDAFFTELSRRTKATVDPFAGLWEPKVAKRVQFTVQDILSGAPLNEALDADLMVEVYHEILKAMGFVDENDWYGFKNKDGVFHATGLQFLVLPNTYLAPSKEEGMSDEEFKQLQAARTKLMFDILKDCTGQTTFKYSAANKYQLKKLLPKLLRLNQPLRYPNAGFKINWKLRGGQDSDSTPQYQAAVWEIDHVESIAEQEEMLKAAGLWDKLVLVYYGGNKSIYAVGIFDDHRNIEETEALVKDLCVTHGFDKALADRAHPANAPFFRHTKLNGKRNYAYILHYNPQARLNFQELRQQTPYHELPKSSISVEQLQGWVNTKKQGVISRTHIIKKATAQAKVREYSKRLSESFSEEQEKDVYTIIKEHVKPCAKALLADGITVDYVVGRFLDACAGINDKPTNVILETLKRGVEAELSGNKKQHTSLIENFKHDEEIDKRFVTNLDELKGTAQTLLLKSVHGTGKTQAMAELSKRRQQEDVMVVALTYRRTNAAELSQRLGLELYDDKVILKAGLHNVSGLALCVDSMPKLDVEKVMKKKFVLVLDETTKLLFHTATAHTEVKNHRLETWEAIIALANAAQEVYCIDADLNNGTVEWIKNNFKGGNVKVVENKYLPEPMTFIRAFSKEEVISLVEQRQLAGGKTALFTSSEMYAKKRDEAQKAFRTKNGLEGNTKLLTADTNDDPTYIPNINERVKELDALTASPVISTGIDINCDHFDTVYGVYNASDHQSHWDILQQLRRVRKPKDGKLVVFIQNRQISVPATEEEIRAGIEALDDYKYKVRYYDHTTRRYEVNEDKVATHKSLVDFIVQYTVYHNKSISNLSESFWELVKHYGHNIIEASELGKEETETIKEAEAIAKEVVVSREITSISEAENISQFEAEELQKRKELTPAEQHKVEKYFISKALGVEPTEVSYEDVDFYVNGGKQAIRNMNLLNKPSDLLADEDYCEANEVAMAVTDRSIALRRQRLLKLIPAQVLAGEKYSARTLDELGFTQAVKDNADELRTVFKGMKVKTKEPVAMVNKLLAKLGLEVEKAAHVDLEQHEPTISIYINNQAVPEETYPEDYYWGAGLDDIKPAPRKRERFYQVTPESIERMNAIMARTNKAQVKQSYYYASKNITELEARLKSLTNQLKDGTITVEVFNQNDAVIQQRLMWLESAMEQLEADPVIAEELAAKARQDTELKARFTSTLQAQLKAA